MEWIGALKRGTALRFIDATERLSTSRGEPRVILGISPDGTRVVVDTLGEVRTCDADLGDWRVLAKGTRALAVGFAAGLVIIAWKQGRLVALDSKGKSVWSGKAAPKALGDIRQLRVNAHGELVAAHELGCVRWLDPATGTELRRLALERTSGTLREFDGETGQADGPEYEADLPEQIVGVDPSGRHALAWLPKLYVGPHHPGDIRLWDLESKSCVAIANGVLHPGKTALNEGGRWALSWSVWAAIDLWDLVARKCLGFRPVKESAGHSLWGPTAAMSPDGRHWVSAVEREICLWEMSAESPIDRIEMPAYPPIDGRPVFSPDGRSLYLCLEGCAVRMAVDLRSSSLAATSA